LAVDANNELSFGCIALGVPIDPIGWYVPAGDSPRPEAPASQIASHRCSPLDEDERIGEGLVVHDKCDSGVSLDGLAFDGRVPRHEDQIVSVQHEPDRRDVRLTVMAARGQLAGARAMGQECSSLRWGHLFHVGLWSGLRAETTVTGQVAPISLPLSVSLLGCCCWPPVSPAGGCPAPSGPTAGAGQYVY